LPAAPAAKRPFGVQDACRHLSLSEMKSEIYHDCLSYPLIGIDTLTLEQRAAGALMSQFMQRQLSHRSENYVLRSDIVYGSAD
jgi:hypothetical protein